MDSLNTKAPLLTPPLAVKHPLRTLRRKVNYGSTYTMWADVSKYNTVVSDSYPYRWFSFRSNDGTYMDPVFTQNYNWAKSAVARGRLDGFMVYFVWRPNWQQTIATHLHMLGAIDPLCVSMMDVESWNGQITGNQSSGINAARESLIAQGYRGNRNRVIGYANAGDFASLWPSRGDTKLVLANYSANPDFPNKIAHQFSSHYFVPPFGYCDINSADGLTSTQLAATLGLSTPNPPPPTGDNNVFDSDALAYLKGMESRINDLNNHNMGMLWRGDQNATNTTHPSILQIQTIVSAMQTQLATVKTDVEGLASGGVDVNALAAQIVSTLGPDVSSEVVKALAAALTKGSAS